MGVGALSDEVDQLIPLRCSCHLGNVSELRKSWKALKCFWSAASRVDCVVTGQAGLSRNSVEDAAHQFADSPDCRASRRAYWAAYASANSNRSCKSGTLADALGGVFVAIEVSCELGCAVPTKAIDIAVTFLTAGLAERGIGAKTASGYGRALLEELRSEAEARLAAYNPPPVQPGNIANEVRVFLALAKRAEIESERRAVLDAAKRMRNRSPGVFANWTKDPARTEEELAFFPRPIIPPPPQH